MTLKEPDVLSRRRWVIIPLALATGLLTCLVGIFSGLIGIGFGNATAAGTAAAFFFMGAWTMLAVRGLIRHRKWTYFGLGLGWALLGGRIIFDWPATASCGVVLLFLLPSLRLPGPYPGNAPWPARASGGPS